MNEVGKRLSPIDIPHRCDNRKRPKKPEVAVIYTRVSTTRQAEFGNSLEDQKKICSRYCALNGLKVLKVFTEPGVTGRTDKRPEFQKMVKFCKDNSKDLKAVVVYDTSRIFRDTMQYLYYKKVLTGLGIELLSPNSQRGDSPVIQLTDTTQAAFAQFESDLKSVRAKESKIEVRRRGRLTNKAPVGYLNVRDTTRPRGTRVEVDPDRAPIIREAFRKAQCREVSLQSIYKWAVSKGLTSPKTGKPISINTFYRLFKNPAYAGMIQVDEDEFVAAEFAGIVSRELFEGVLERLRDFAAQDSRKPTRKDEFPLKGVLRCPGCSKLLTASYQRGKSGKYYGYYHLPKHGLGCPQAGLFVPLKAADGAIQTLLDEVSGDRAFLDSLRDVVSHKQSTIERDVRMSREELVAIVKSQESLKTAAREKYILGLLDRDDYEEVKESSERKVYSAKAELQKLDRNDKPIEEILESALEVLEHLGISWKSASRRAKSKIAHALFPSGITIDKREGVGTPLNAHEMGLLDLFDWGDSLLATPTGFEPVLPA